MSPPIHRKKQRRKKERSSSSPTLRAGAGAETFLRAKKWASLASVGLLLGILLTATGGAILGSFQGMAQSLAPWISVVSMAVAIAAAHNLGRCGPDPGEEDEPTS